MERRRPPRGGGAMPTQCSACSRRRRGTRGARGPRRPGGAGRLLEAVPGERQTPSPGSRRRCTSGATAPRSRPCSPRCPPSTDRPDPGRGGRRCLPVVRDALRTNDTRLVAAALGPYAAAHLDDAAWRQAVRQGDLHGHRPRRRRRPRRRAPTTSCAAWCATTSPSVGPPGARCPPTPGGSCPPTSPPPPPGRSSTMRIFDPHIHMTSRTTDDYERMHAAGVRAVVEPSFWLGQPRTSVGSFCDYFDALLGWEPFRAPAVRHPALRDDRPQPQGGQRRAVPGGARRAAALPRQGPRRRRRRARLRLDDAGGGRGLRRTSSALAREHELPALVHTPHRDKLDRHPAHPRRRPRVGLPSRARARRPPQRGHRGRRRRQRAAGWASPIYPDTKMDPHRMVAILRSTAPSGWSSTPPPTGAAATRSSRCAPPRRCSPAASTTTTSTGCSGATRSSSTAQSGRLELPETEGPQAELVGAESFKGNSVLRGSRDG